MKQCERDKSINQAKWQNVENLQSAKNGNEIAFVESKIDPTTEEPYFLRKKKLKDFLKENFLEDNQEKEKSFFHTRFAKRMISEMKK